MLLLDTHIWIRWQNHSGLPSHFINRIAKEEVFISAISCWEVAQLVKRKRIELSIPTSEWIDLASQTLTILPINKEIAILSENLQEHHKDPADRFIIASSVFYNLSLMSLDTMFPKYSEVRDLLILP